MNWLKIKDNNILNNIGLDNNLFLANSGDYKWLFVGAHKNKESSKGDGVANRILRGALNQQGDLKLDSFNDLITKIEKANKPPIKGFAIILVKQDKVSIAVYGEYHVGIYNAEGKLSKEIKGRRRVENIKLKKGETIIHSARPCLETVSKAESKLKCEIIRPDVLAISASNPTDLKQYTEQLLSQGQYVLGRSIGKLLGKKNNIVWLNKASALVENLFLTRKDLAQQNITKGKKAYQKFVDTQSNDNTIIPNSIVGYIEKQASILKDKYSDLENIKPTVKAVKSPVKIIKSPIGPEVDKSKKTEKEKPQASKKTEKTKKSFPIIFVLGFLMLLIAGGYWYYDNYLQEEPFIVPSDKYETYIQLGDDALIQDLYTDAIHYFDSALIVRNGDSIASQRREISIRKIENKILELVKAKNCDAANETLNDYADFTSPSAALQQVVVDCSTVEPVDTQETVITEPPVVEGSTKQTIFEQHMAEGNRWIATSNSDLENNPEAPLKALKAFKKALANDVNNQLANKKIKATEQLIDSKCKTYLDAADEAYNQANDILFNNPIRTINLLNKALDKYRISEKLDRNLRFKNKITSQIDNTNILLEQMKE